MHQQSGWTATPSRLIGASIAIQPFLRRMPFLAQPSQFILAWDRHQICWLTYPVAWGDNKWRDNIVRLEVIAMLHFLAPRLIRDIAQ